VDSEVSSRAARFYQALLLATFLPLCWLWMMAVHELGHVAGAWLTGGTVQRVVLHPLAFSRTDVAPNPQPVVVVWAGPLVGVLLPLAMLAVWKLNNWPAVHLIRFFAGFCLIANGAYIGAGSWSAIGDAGDMLRAGSPAWTLWLFGLLTIPLGLCLWNGSGPRYGFGKTAIPIDGRTTFVTAGLLLITIVAEVVTFSM